jgi:glycosyltransferase involved in cell wall biosynthesis
MINKKMASKYPRPSKYPMVIFLRQKKDTDLDYFILSQFEVIQFAYEIVEFDSSKINVTEKAINKLYCEEYNVLVTVGDSWEEYKEIHRFLIPKINAKWIHLKKNEILSDINKVNQQVINCFISYIPRRDLYRPKISCFTTSFKSFEKIMRPFNSLLKQTYKDWEWVIIDDSDDDKHFKYMKENVSSKDYRIRYFRKDYNNGNIGNVKNEAVSLCRGEYLLELDHDDEILPDCLEEIVSGFQKYPEVGFIYMNFSECYEDFKPFSYGKGWGMGYGDYYTQQYNGHEFQVATSVDINDLTMSNIVGVPNHPRAWRKSVLMEIGNYSECLPIADDYEILVLTALNTKMLKINKLGYIQYKNSGNNNFSLIRNKEITKLQNQISHHYYQKFNIPEFFRNQGVEEKLKKKGNKINLTVETCINPLHHS